MTLATQQKKKRVKIVYVCTGMYVLMDGQTDGRTDR